MANFGLAGGHKRWSDREGFQSFFDADTPIEKEMICSEFVARSIISSVMELNKQLQAELGTKEEIVKIPFDKKERIKRIHPQRLIELLQESGALEQVPPSKVLTQFVQIDELDKQKLFHKAEAALKKDDIALLLEDKDKVKEELQKFDGTQDIIIAIDKLTKEREYKILYTIIDKFKKIFGIKTTQDKLKELVRNTCKEAQDIIVASKKKTYVQKLQEARQQHLGPGPQK